MWVKEGSNNQVLSDGIKNALYFINRKKLGGHNDWRVPTVEELASLMSKPRTKGGVFLNSVFAKDYDRAWTSDAVPGRIWIVNFSTGNISPIDMVKTSGGMKTGGRAYVKAVRNAP